MSKDKKKMNVKKIIDFFDLNIVNSKDIDLDYNDIYQPAIKRVGLELAEQFENDRISKNVIAWGTAESIWFSLVGKKKAYESLEWVFSRKPPIVILSKGFNKPAINWVIDVANKYRIPIALVRMSTSYISTNIGSYLNNYFGEVTQVHGTLVLIGGTGVLITGDSGIGKSEAALQLVQQGSVLISDDAVLIKDNGNIFIGSSPAITRNFLEIRGIGLVDVTQLYGISSVAKSSVIDLVIELVRQEEKTDFDRLGTEYLEYPIFGRSIKKMQIPIKEGGSAASLIKAAVNTFLARNAGMNVVDTIYERSLKENDE
ncbi:HPr(Ser) kinase/phosphatase [Mycoplasmopsis verecunda]|uniref:Hpr(Ser) kinase/phosphatase n=1 Tax=Mycoplasmopsis verecunda TaxID=171291 RepID=A0A1T4KS36_9BACT|nr:HPr(Ser) kinase/phosphatase [Mycoplasmopsis verecunda]WPB54678.1 HPr(Ser) kinase/phosphatase [Mycoplasmopsis verecunda]SJZ45231.1 Hpr(Ser) kinase/phosphatase [Mycoplasmopsis verecunda]